MFMLRGHREGKFETMRTLSLREQTALTHTVIITIEVIYNIHIQIITEVTCVSQKSPRVERSFGFLH